MTVFALPIDQHSAHAGAQRLYRRLEPDLIAILPSGCHIRHIGATAIPDCLTKGDLDVVVRCEAAAFALADRALASRFARNLGSVRTADFSAFEDRNSAPECGVQLTVRGGPLDVFHLFADALSNDPTLVRRYNALKRAHDGQAMDAYRRAKDAFVQSVLASP